MKPLLVNALLFLGVWAWTAACSLQAAGINIAFQNGLSVAAGLTNRPDGVMVATSSQFWNSVVSNQLGLAFPDFPLRDEFGSSSGATLSASAGYGGVNNINWSAQNQDWVMMNCWYGLMGAEFISVSNLGAPSPTTVTLCASSATATS